MPDVPAVAPAPAPVEAAPAAAAPPPAPATDLAARVAQLEAQLHATNKEAAERRVSEKAAKEAAANAEKAKAEAENRWQDVAKIDREKADALAKEIESYRAKAAEADPYRAAVEAQVASLKASLGDKAASVAGLSPAQALPILQQIQALAAGAGAAPKPIAGNPATPIVGTSLDEMQPDQRRQYLNSLPRAERQKLLAERTGSEVSAPRFARVNTPQR